MAVHPSGHLIATGHADGSIVFWAIEDEDKPLLAITLDGIQDVNVAKADELEAALAGEHNTHDNAREPIFKLAWSGFENSSDPRGGETALTVLGGLSHNDVSGLTTLLLPAFSPPGTISTVRPRNLIGPGREEGYARNSASPAIPLLHYCWHSSGLPAPTAGAAPFFRLLGSCRHPHVV